MAVFASSLLSLISPWARSRGARSRRSPARCPRPVAPPPPPRRHSHPTHTPTPIPTHTPTHTTIITDTATKYTIDTKHRRYSEHRNPHSKLDLRQELQNLNLNNREVDKWLGAKFEEKNEYDTFDDRFEHDIPLQRSISLDGGIDIFNYLQSIGSDWTGSSTVSSWTINSDGRESRTFDRYRSFEDIPASQNRVRSRRASFDEDNAFSGRSLAYSVLKGSYKGVHMGSGSVSPQIKKLQKCYTFANFEDLKGERISTENLVEMDQEKPKLLRVQSSKAFGSGRVSPQMSGLQRYFSFREPAENSKMIQKVDHDIEVGEGNNDLDIRVPFYRSISIDSKYLEKDTDNRNFRKRRSGLQVIKNEPNLRKEVLLRQNLSKFKSCEELLVGKRAAVNRISNETELTPERAKILEGKNVGFDCVILPDVHKLRRTFSFASSSDILPTIIISRADRSSAASGVAKNKKNITMNTSNLVEIGRNCDCRICTDDGEDRNCFLRNVLSKLFIKIVTCREYGRKLTYWDENNNLNDGEMYKCIMHVLKLMLGLWLRHYDHN